jgi:hypothetical protein
MKLPPETIARLREKYLQYKHSQHREKLRRQYAYNLPIFCNVVNLEEGDTIAKMLIYTNKATIRYNGKTLFMDKNTLVEGAKILLDGKTFIIDSLDIHPRHTCNYIFVVDVNKSILYN